MKVNQKLLIFLLSKLDTCTFERILIATISVNSVVLSLSGYTCAAGGTFALYSLLCRYCNISSLPNHHPSDVELTTYLVEHANQKTRLQKRLEASAFLQNVLLIIVLLGTCMVIGDGILTPAISGRFLIAQLLG